MRSHGISQQTRQVAHQAGAFKYFYFPLDGMLVHRRVIPPALNSPVMWVERSTVRVKPKNTTQCPRPGLEPGPLDPETSALPMRPLRLPANERTKKDLRETSLLVMFVGVLSF